MKKASQLILLFLVIFVIVAIMTTAKNIKIQEIICNSQMGRCQEKISSKLLSLKGKAIPEAILSANKILKEENNVLRYSINLELPPRLKVDIIERVPSVAFKLNNKKFALIDDEGIVTDEVDSTNLPKILSSTKLTKEQLIFIISLMKNLNVFYNVNTGNISDDTLLVEANGKKILFPTNGDEKYLLGGLNLIFSRLSDLKDASTISTIDLRYKNPVLR
jgi:cell division septal protein FtsQ